MWYFCALTCWASVQSQAGVPTALRSGSVTSAGDSRSRSAAGSPAPAISPSPDSFPAPPPGRMTVLPWHQREAKAPRPLHLDASVPWSTSCRRPGRQPGKACWAGSTKSGVPPLWSCWKPNWGCDPLYRSATERPTPTESSQNPTVRERERLLISLEGSYLLRQHTNWNRAT